MLALAENIGSVILWNTLLCIYKEVFTKIWTEAKNTDFFCTDVGFQKCFQFSSLSNFYNFPTAHLCPIDPAGWAVISKGKSKFDFHEKQQKIEQMLNFVKSKSIFNQRSDQPPDRDSISCSVKFQPCFGCPLWKLNTLKFLWKLAKNFLKIWKFSKNLKIFQKSENFLKIWKFSENQKIFCKSENFPKNLSD